MKRIYSMLFVTGLMAMVVSCKKTTTTPTNNNNNNNNNNTNSPTPPSPSVGNVDGALVAINMQYTYLVSGYNVQLPTDIAAALFYSSPGSSTYVDAGAVSLNSVSLDKGTTNSYTKTATTGMTPASLSLDNGTTWSVGGGNGVPAISYTNSSGFPAYSGTLPSSITKANGISFTFNAGSVSNADSVYVLVASGSNSVLKHYSATQGSITITSADLSGLATVSNNTALLEVCPFHVDLKTYGSKQYAFVKEQAVVQAININ